MMDNLWGLIDWMAKIIPKIEVISTKEAGVAWVRGKPRVINPGRVFIYWPIWTDVEWIEMKPIAMELASQGIAVKVGREMQTLTVSGMIVWQVKDPMLAICKVDDIEDYIAQSATAIIRNETYGKTIKEIVDNEGEIEDAMKRNLQKSLRGCGVTIKRIFWSNFTICKAHMLFGDILGGGVEEW